ncbi:hypothetical protein [Demequina zhanjiangensis]|uniref:Uncharacterized protein n=1 Tax=Demequina zhanjiangensis TaxID=3051659 RepID=A0ABT8G341_9MICO|nr:hypothetical protein [Demequina sp. SYSU T00b26]MDN4473567.1 hypothetical protein [Demequina sp. SYSU T00b26]
MARGFNVASDVFQRTIDGFDLGGIWNDFQDALQVYNQGKAPILALLTHSTTATGDPLALDGGRLDFEEASEFGVPKSGRVEPDYYVAGYDLKWFDLAQRYTAAFLRDATAEQVRTQHIAAMEGSDRLQWTMAINRLMTPALEGSRPVNPEGQSIYSLYAGSTDDAPPEFKGRTFATGHNHYLVSGAATVDGQDLEDAIEHVAHHGYGVGPGERIILLVHPNEGAVIRGFRAGVNGSPFDFIPSAGGVPYITTERIVGAVPAGEFNGLPVIGSFGKALVVETYDAFAGYVVAIAHGGNNSTRNALSVRSHTRPELKGLRMIPGTDDKYPLSGSTYGIGVGFGVRNRGAAAVVQITASGSYSAPTI